MSSGLTPQEIKSYLRHSSLNNVLIEGKDDLLIYRKMEEDLAQYDINFYPCGGRSTVLRIYDEKEDLNRPCFYICDADLWIFMGVPTKYADKDDLIITNGYSIENELYQESKDFLLSTLSKEEKVKKEALLKTVVSWYACQIKQKLTDDTYSCKFESLNLLNTLTIETNKTDFSQTFLDNNDILEETETQYQDIITNYTHQLRGKYIFKIFEKIFMERDRAQVKYRMEHIFDMSYSYTVSQSSETNPSPFLTRKNTIQQFFQIA